MKLENVEITDEEMNKAVQLLLGTCGLTVKVKSIGSVGYPRRGWRIDVETEGQGLAPETEE